MSGLGEFDYSSFKEFADGLNEAVQKEFAEVLLRDLMNEVGTVLLGNVRDNTPVGQYEDGWVEFVATDKNGNPVDVRFWASAHGKRGGNLRDGWFIGGATIVSNYVVLTLYNNVHYAEYVEKGHRTVNGGWVEGQFFLKATVEELEEKLSSIIEPKYIEYLERIFG